MSWTLTPSIVTRAKNFVRWKVVCTSDASACAATDLMALMSDAMKRIIGGSSLMTLTVSPGTGGVIPNTTIDITLRTNSDVATDLIFSKTTISKDAVTPAIDLSEDYPVFPPVYDVLYITINDIGDAGDQVTLYFENFIG
jgi:hypothetical protein